MVHSTREDNGNKRTVPPTCPLEVKGPLNKTYSTQETHNPATFMYIEVLQDQQSSHNDNLVTKLQLFRIERLCYYSLMIAVETKQMVTLYT